MKKTFAALCSLFIVNSAIAGQGTSKPAQPGPTGDSLFYIEIGGNTKSSHVELHDVRFAVADKIENTYQGLKSEWWGDPSSLHLDCWGAVTYVDGHNIEIHNVPQETDKKLFFVNLGGYNPGEWGEKHINVFVVAKNDAAASKKAKEENFPKTKWGGTAHKDFSWEVDKVLDVSSMAARNGKYIHLIPNTSKKEFQFKCSYTPIANR